MSEVELESTREKAKQPAKKRSFWLSRPAAILIIICFFFPWLSYSCYYSGYSTGMIYSSGAELALYTDIQVSVSTGVTLSANLLSSSQANVSSGFLSLLLYLPLGALVCLILSFKKPEEALTIPYAIFSISAFSLIIYIQLILTIQSYLSPFILVMLIFLSVTGIYLLILRTKNTKALQNYTIFLIVVSGAFLAYYMRVRNIGSGGLEPAFYITYLAIGSFLVSAYLAFKEGLPPDKPKRGEKRFI